LTLPAEAAEFIDPSDNRLAHLLTEMGMERHISWHKAAAILDAYEAPEAAQLATRRSKQHVQSPPGDERDLALAIFLREASGQVWLGPWPEFWFGANPEEAFVLDLRVSNPGDHSKLNQRSPEQLLQDLVVLRQLAPSRWRHERIAATRRERKRRAGA
jgi:hypothetical protein